MDFDVIVIGAGPVGGVVARDIATKGYSVALVEEHREIGEPVQCSGLVTPRVLKIHNIRRALLNKVRGANIFSPSGRMIKIASSETKAIIIDRSTFDKEIVEDALRMGATTFLSSPAVGAKKKDNGVEVRFLREEKEEKALCKILIGADGVKSNVARWFSLSRPEILISGFQAVARGIEMADDFVNVYIGNDVAPRFFAWIIPTGRFRRVGLGVRNGNPYSYFLRLLEAGPTKSLLRSAQFVGFQAGAIPLGIPKSTFCDNVMIVGDAASQVKATSGGGLYMGLTCAQHCAKTAIEALEDGDFSEHKLGLYQQRWKKDVGQELRRDILLHKAFCRLKDKDFEEIFRLLGREEIVELISREGDIDFPSRLGFSLLKKEPRLLRFLGPGLRAVFKRSL